MWIKHGPEVNLVNTTFAYHIFINGFSIFAPHLRLANMSGSNFRPVSEVSKTKETTVLQSKRQ